jgi:hypothetical protein
LARRRNSTREAARLQTGCGGRLLLSWAKRTRRQWHIQRCICRRITWRRLTKASIQWWLGWCGLGMKLRTEWLRIKRSNRLKWLGSTSLSKGGLHGIASALNIASRSWRRLLYVGASHGLLYIRKGLTWYKASRSRRYRRWRTKCGWCGHGHEWRRAVGYRGRRTEGWSLR